MTSFLAGYLLLLGLIVALGAQNVLVLRQGLRREHVGLVVALCAASDAVLIAVGVAGLRSITDAVPAVLPAARWGGVVFLLAYAALAASLRRGAVDVAHHGVVRVAPSFKVAGRRHCRTHLVGNGGMIKRKRKRKRLRLRLRWRLRKGMTCLPVTGSRVRVGDGAVVWATDHSQDSPKHAAWTAKRRHRAVTPCDGHRAQ